jgi:hypothetical protein
MLQDVARYCIKRIACRSSIGSHWKTRSYLEYNYPTFTILGDRITVVHIPLEDGILVRIQVSQPEVSKANEGLERMVSEVEP